LIWIIAGKTARTHSSADTRARSTMPVRSLILLVLASACAPAAPEPSRQARADYAEFCAACHGEAGRGDGALASGLDRPPADLTALSRGTGGSFPKVRVMSKIDGFLRTRHGGGGAMPAFGEVLASPLVTWDDGSGRPVPVPSRLLGLADYLETLQE
jgi:mono/diheme cytochrome c family protein